MCGSLALMFLPSAAPTTEPAYAALGAALLVGSLLVVRLRADVPGTPLLFLPALVAEVRFGMAALPALALATLAGRLVLRRRITLGTLVGASHDTLAYAAAHVAAGLVSSAPLVAAAVFAVSNPLASAALWALARVAAGARSRMHDAGPPDVLVSVTLAPLAGLPLAAAAGVGDGGLLLGLAGLFIVLLLAVEARNLATARFEVETQRDRLARANELQRDLFHLMTHELKTPLSAVLLYQQLAERAVRQAAIDRVPAQLGGIERAAKSMQRLIDNLLQISRMEESGDLPPPEPVDLKALSAQAVADHQALADAKQQSLALDLPDVLPTIVSSPVLLREGLNNLISNAIKYTPTGGSVRVWVQTRDPSREVVLGVTDTGIGMSSQDLERLFTRFFRSGNPTASAERGSGLGLALTRAIIVRIGGRIEVDSALNQGTTFRVVLPYTRQ